MKKSTKVISMMIGIFLCMLDTTVMNIALPAIQVGLATDLAHLSWALNIYTVLFDNSAWTGRRCLGPRSGLSDWTGIIWPRFRDFGVMR